MKTMLYSSFIAYYSNKLNIYKYTYLSFIRNEMGLILLTEGILCLTIADLILIYLTFPQISCLLHWDYKCFLYLRFPVLFLLQRRHNNDLKYSGRL